MICHESVATAVVLGCDSTLSCLLPFLTPFCSLITGDICDVCDAHPPPVPVINYGGSLWPYSRPVKHHCSWIRWRALNLWVNLVSSGSTGSCLSALFLFFSITTKANITVLCYANLLPTPVVDYGDHPGPTVVSSNAIAM